MPVDRTNVLVGISNLYTAPEGTPFPADTVAFGTAWTAPWAHVGATEEGVNLVAETDTEDIRIEEQATPVIVGASEKNVGFETVLSEDTLETIKLVMGGGSIVTQAAGVGTIGKSTLTLTDDIERLAVGLEGKNKQGFFRRIFVPSAVAIADVEAQYRRAEDARRYGVELRAICALSEITIVSKTANATS
jgi:hypothetical protein